MTSKSTDRRGVALNPHDGTLIKFILLLAPGQGWAEQTTIATSHMSFFISVVCARGQTWAGPIKCKIMSLPFRTQLCASASKPDCILCDNLYGARLFCGSPGLFSRKTEVNSCFKVY